MRRRVLSCCVSLAIALVVLAHGAVDASASFTSQPAASAGSISTATLAAPTGLATGCFILTPTHVRVSWTASASSFVAGYDVARSSTSGGPYSVVGSVSSATTTYTDTRPNTNTYYYVVRATKFGWSAQSAEKATPVTCLL
jgi:hypothetical protein